MGEAPQLFMASGSYEGPRCTLQHTIVGSQSPIDKQGALPNVGVSNWEDTRRRTKHLLPRAPTNASNPPTGNTAYWVPKRSMGASCSIIPYLTGHWRPVRTARNTKSDAQARRDTCAMTPRPLAARSNAWPRWTLKLKVSSKSTPITSTRCK